MCCINLATGPWEQGLYNRIWEHPVITGWYPENKIHGANMGSIWGRQDPGGPHIGPMNFVIWVVYGNQSVHLELLVPAILMVILHSDG